MRYPRIWSHTTSFLISQNAEKSGLIFKALHGRLRTPFLITSVAQGHTNQLAYWGGVSHQRYRPLKIGQLLAEVLSGLFTRGVLHKCGHRYVLTALDAVPCW